jgi:predicted DNA-binding WGR domain protein
MARDIRGVTDHQENESIAPRRFILPIGHRFLKTRESVHACVRASTASSSPDRCEPQYARFYLLSIQPTLFGGASLIRNWGRIGTNGQTMMQTFDDSMHAGDAFGRLVRTKRRRGYDDAER